MDDYRAASSWLAPNSGDGLGTGERFLRRGKDGAFILRILDDELAISKGLGEQTRTSSRKLSLKNERVSDDSNTRDCQSRTN
jgi:hypothetical protein